MVTLLYVPKGATVINTAHVASVQIVPAVRPGTNIIERVELHFIVSGGKIVHILPDDAARKITKYFMNPLVVEKLSKALLTTWMEISKEPSPEVIIAITIDDFIERIIKKLR